MPPNLSGPTSEATGTSSVGGFRATPPLAGTGGSHWKVNPHPSRTPSLYWQIRNHPEPCPPKPIKSNPPLDLYQLYTVFPQGGTLSFPRGAQYVVLGRLRLLPFHCIAALSGTTSLLSHAVHRFHRTLSFVEAEHSVAQSEKRLFFRFIH